MINVIWCFFIIISIVFSIFSGNLVNVNQSIFSSINETVKFIINMFGSMCFWCGIIKIISETTLQKKLKKIIHPINKKIFKNLDEKTEVYENISINMITNMLGIGSAATPAGLKAVDELEKINPYEDQLSDEMIMFIAINTASLQIIPTNVISIRNSLNSVNPSGIILGVWFSSILTFISIIFLTKIYLKMRGKQCCICCY